MLSENDTAPEFRLPGVEGFPQSEDKIETYDLHAETARGNSVLLVFYPFDFSPVCTSELCGLRDSEWFQFVDDLTVWGISKDSVYAHDSFIDSYELTFPLLSDSAGRVAREFGVCHDEINGHYDVPQRSVFLITPDNEITYSWTTDTLMEIPETSPIFEAIEQLSEHTGETEPSEADIDIDYEDPTPEPEARPSILDADD
jgi:peroxiredoxin